VPQFDFGNGSETVFESLMFVSNIKAEYGSKAYLKSRGMSKADVLIERRVHINLLLDILGLTGVKDCQVGNSLKRGISGGQRRRLTLAKGLISGPSVVFADEPTSGLSSTDSELVIAALKDICKYLSVTCILVIHQPKLSVFQMFDHLMLFSQGHCVYNASAVGAEAYFEQLGFPVPKYTNPSDWFLDCITPGAGEPEMFISKYVDVAIEVKVTGPSETEILENEIFRRGRKVVLLPWYYSTTLVTKRGMLLMFRDLNTLGVIVGQSVLSGLLIGLIYLNARDDPSKITYQISFIFIFIITAALASMNNIPVLVEDRVVFQNEWAEAYYGTAPYMISRIAQSMFVAVVTNLLFLAICYFMAGFEGSVFFYMFLLTLVTYSTVDALISVFVCVSSGAQMANSLAALVITVMTLFNGYTSNTTSSPAGISWINYLSPFFWAFWGSINALFEDYDFNQPGIPTDLNSYQKILNLYGFSADFKWYALLIIFCYGILFRFLQFLALHYLSNLKK